MDVVTIDNNISMADLQADFDMRAENKTGFFGLYEICGRKIICDYKYTYAKGGYIKTQRFYVRWVDNFTNPKVLYMDWLEQKDGSMKSTRYPVKVRA